MWQVYRKNQAVSVLPISISRYLYVVIFFSYDTTYSGGRPNDSEARIAPAMRRQASSFASQTTTIWLFIALNVLNLTLTVLWRTASLWLSADDRKSDEKLYWKNRQYRYKLTSRSVRITNIEVEKEEAVSTMCLRLCSCLSLPAWNSHSFFVVLYRHLWHLWLNHSVPFPHYLTNGTIFWQHLLDIRYIVCFAFLHNFYLKYLF